MKLLKKYLIPIILLVCIISVSVIGIIINATSPWYSFFYDASMNHGLAVTHTDINADGGREPIGFLDYAGEALAYPENFVSHTNDFEKPYTWKLSQFASKYNILDGNFTKLSAGHYKYNDNSKTFEINTNTGRFVQGINGSAEYDTPRLDSSTSWTGILLQYNPVEQIYLKNLKRLRLRFDYKIDKVDLKMAEEEFDPGLHTAHLLFYMFIKNAKNDDFFFCGIPLYDYRHEFCDEYQSQDNPDVKESTSKFVYCPSQKEYMSSKVVIGKEKKINYDYLSVVKRAFKQAQKSGYMQGAKFEDLTINGINFGWEIPGTFDVQSTVSKFEINYKLK